MGYLVLNSRKLEISYIPLTMLRLPERDSRFYRPSKRLTAMIKSVRDMGIMIPLAVSTVNHKIFTVIDGATRFLACQSLRLSQAPCIVYENLSRVEFLIIRGRLNIQRNSYDPVAVARDMLEMHMDHKMSYRAIANAYGFTKGWVSKLMALNRCPADMRLKVSRHELSVLDAYQWERSQRARKHIPEPVSEYADEFTPITRRCRGCKRILQPHDMSGSVVFCGDCLDVALDAVKRHVEASRRDHKIPVKASELYRGDKGVS